MSDIQVPVAFCRDCDEHVPVVFMEIKKDQWVGGDFPGDMTFIYCPSCKEVLNLMGDIEIKWYSSEELPKAIGWRVSE